MKIKLAFVASSLEGGGAERIFLNIMNSLSLADYEIQLISTSPDSVAEKVKDGIAWTSYGNVHAKSAFFRVRKDLRDFSPDYVFTTHFPIAYMLPMIRLLNRQSFRIMIRIAVPPSEVPKRSWWVNLKGRTVKALSRWAFRRADLIIAQTESMKVDILRHYPLYPDKIRVIRNIVDEPFLLRQGDAYVPAELEAHHHYNIIAAGALYSVKGFDLLISAMAAVVKTCPQARLYILGEERYEIGYKKKLENLVKTLSLQEQVFLLGFKANPYPYYKHADLFVMASRNEGYPNVVLEALYYKTPVVATNCVDFKGVIRDGENGYVVKTKSTDQLADGILKAYHTLKKPCQVQLENFNYEELFRC